MSNEAMGVLSDLTAAAARTRKGARSVGRYARTPKFEAAAQKSSRPDMGGGTTFHFAHKALSKRNDVSDGQGTMTSAMAHQGYIERREAGAAVDTDTRGVMQDWARAREDEPTSTTLGNGDAGKDEDAAKAAGFVRPDFSWSADRTGFGTLGSSPVERKEFWQKVERTERRHGRVQSRVIAELPHEASPAERAKIALEFCAHLDKLGLPYWASIHAPTGKNDGRNHHLHVAYSERPARKNAEGVWDFEHTVIHKKSNRSKVAVRPFLQNKPAQVRARGWVKSLRLSYAEAANGVLEAGGHGKRMDPRSYKDAGLTKEPTRHLGFKAHAMESFGLDTKVGVENAEKEARWNIQNRTRRWERAKAVEDVAGLFLDEIQSEGFWAQSEGRRARIDEGFAAALEGAENENLSERLTLRLDKRMGFLDKEGTRLLVRGRGLRIASVAMDVVAIDAEKTALESREEEARTIARALQANARAARKKEAAIWSELFGNTSTVATGLPYDVGVQDDIWDIPGGEPAPAPVPKAPDQTAKEQPKVPKDAIKGAGETKPTVDARADSTEGAKTPEDGTTKEQPTSPLPTPETTGTDGFAKGMKQGRDEGVLLVGRLSGKADVRALDAALQAMPNKETRLRAIATRDLVDILEPGPLREQANRGWVVLRSEAQRRGLDLDTGRHDPKKGTDRERAEIHKDEYLASVLEVRQEVTIVRGR